MSLSELIITISGTISIVSFFAIGLYFLNRNIYTCWEFRRKLLWLEVIYQYRDHTRKNAGNVGIWYYILLISILITIISVLTMLAIKLRAASWPVIFVVVFSALLIIPLLGYAIYNMSKEKCF